MFSSKKVWDLRAREQKREKKGSGNSAFENPQKEKTNKQLWQKIPVNSTTNIIQCML